MDTVSSIPTVNGRIISIKIKINKGGRFDFFTFNVENSELNQVVKRNLPKGEHVIILKESESLMFKNRAIVIRKHNRYKSYDKPLRPKSNIKSLLKK